MKFVIPILIFITFTAILTAANIYLSNRIGWIFSIEKLKWIHIALTAAIVLAFVGLAVFSNTQLQVGSMLYSISAIVIGLLLYLLISFLALEIPRLIFNLHAAQFGALTFSLTILISGYALWNATTTKLSEVEIPVDGLKHQKKIMHWTDIHLGHFRGESFLDRLVQMTNNHEIDFVALTGDLFDGRMELREETLAPLKKLKVPVYFVEGNHDGYSGVEEIKSLLRKTGVRVLENEIVEEGDIQIVGLNHLPAEENKRSMHAAGGKSSIKEVLGGLQIKSAEPSLLLHHSPAGIEYAAEKGIDVYLAGHTHGGQLFPLTLLNDLLFKYNRGLYAFNGTRIFVSKGLGTFGPPMRLGTRGEIALITLIPASTD